MSGGTSSLSRCICPDSTGALSKSFIYKKCLFSSVLIADINFRFEIYFGLSISLNETISLIINSRTLKRRSVQCFLRNGKQVGALD